MDKNGDSDVGLEIEAGRIFFRLRGSRTPRSMALADCAGVSLSMAPRMGPMGMAIGYRVTLLGDHGDAGISIGDTPDLSEARQIWRRAADRLEKPAVAMTPDGRETGAAPPGPPPPGINRTEGDGRIRVIVRRGWVEYAFVSALALGLAAILVLGERSVDNLFFIALAAGLLGYAVIGGLSAHFIDLADGKLTAGIKTPFGEFGRTEMAVADIETVLWGKAENRPGKHRAAVAIAAGDRIKTFDRLTDDQARWLTRFVSGLRRN